MKEKYYSVMFVVHNKNSDAWASKVTWSGKDERDAWANYCSEQSRLTGSKEFDVVNVFLLDEGDCFERHLTDERLDPEEIIE